MNVYLSELAEAKLLILNDYLLIGWSVQIRDKFFDKFTRKLNLILLRPQICPQSMVYKGLYKCVVTKQTTFYYRIAI
jgi:hypothetical protein